MYSNDSFFTLSSAGQAGLLVLSVILATVVMLLAWRLGPGRSLLTRLTFAALLFGAFVWLSPQVYYAYYWFLFDGLPVQWVIGWPPLSEAIRKATFTGPSNLSAHAQGVLFWVLVAIALEASGVRGLRR